jgi:hypothetical protein
MKSTTRVAGFLAVALSATFALATPSGAAPPSPVLPPPSADVFVATSNAMMRPSDVPTSLLPDEAWSVSYMSPPGGQDPYPVCISSPRRSLDLPLRDAMGYQSGAYGLTQVVYAYASPQIAQAAWATVNRQVPAKCSGKFMLGDSLTTVTSGRLAATATTPAGWWVRTDVAGAAAGASYVTVRPVGDSIQMVFYSNIPSNTTQAQRAGVDALSRTLAVRLADAAALPVTQDPLLTSAQRAMITSTDVPASLPFTLPANGGWSSFTSYAPGNGPWACNGPNLPAGEASFETALGGDGGVVSEPGAWDQRLEVYPTAAAASAAWRKLTKAVLSCTGGSRGPLSPTKPASRQWSGTSALTFNGTAGVWSRDLDSQPSAASSCTDNTGRRVACPEFTSKSYTIHLLMGTAIQSVSYYTSVDGIRDMPLDQAAVNAVAEQLALRWVATAAG